MKIIKVSSGSSHLTNLLLRQTPGSSGIWRDCRFVINQNIDTCDAWFVLHHSGLMYTDQTVCDPSKVFYVSMEPYESVGNVSPDFLRQFEFVIGCDPELPSPRTIRKNLHTWWVGIDVRHSNNSHSFSPIVNLSYDDLAASQNLSTSKLNRICCIVSTKKFLDGHKNRVELAAELADTSAGEFIDFFGGLGQPFADKYELQSRYKYSLVMENTILADYWSEKLADTFLSSSFPLYLGCPNIHDYFNSSALILLNEMTSTQVSERLCFVIGNDVYSKASVAIDLARKSVLHRYNVFNEMVEFVSSPDSTKKLIRIRPNVSFVETFPQGVHRRLSRIKRTILGDS